MPARLRDLAGSRSVLIAICEVFGSPCHHSRTFGLDELIAICGPDIDTQELRRRLRCSRCGARNPAILLSSKAADKFSGMGSSWGGGEAQQN